MATIGQRVRAVRDLLGITQAELADRMGFSRNYISLVEHGREPSHRFEKGLRLIEQAPIPHFQQKSGPFDATPRGMIKARRQELGLSLDELARRTGCQKSMLRNVEEGHNRASESLLRKLSTHLDLPLDDLMDGSDYPHLTEAGRTVGADANIETEPGVKARVIPLLSWAQAGTTQAWEDVYEHEGFIGFNVRDQKAVAVKIRGDSMAPQFPEGTVAIVYPSWEAKSGDLVIARLDDGTVMFKRLHVDGDFYTFISLNPIYPPRTVEKSKVERLLPVGGTYLNQLE